MATYSRNDVVLVRYPYSNLSGAKVRPAIVVSEPHVSNDVFLVPLTSRIAPLLPGEFVLGDWHGAGLNVPTAVKRGVYTLHQQLIVATVGRLAQNDARGIAMSLRGWLGL